MDDSGMDVPDLRHRAGKFLGVLRTRLGWLVVLGSRRERFVHAVAGRHRVDSLTRGNRKARRIQKLDGTTGDRRLFAQPAGNISGSFRSPDLGSRFRQRSKAGSLYSGFPHVHHWRIVNSLCLACEAGGSWIEVRSSFARIAVADE